jgi:hypothetical protein
LGLVAAYLAKSPRMIAEYRSFENGISEAIFDLNMSNGSEVEAVDPHVDALTYGHRQLAFWTPMFAKCDGSVAICQKFHVIMRVSAEMGVSLLDEQTANEKVIAAMRLGCAALRAVA